MSAHIGKHDTFHLQNQRESCLHGTACEAVPLAFVVEATDIPFALIAHAGNVTHGTRLPVSVPNDNECDLALMITIVLFCARSAIAYSSYAVYQA